MYIHVIQDEKFTDQFIKFINRNYNPDEHVIYVYRLGERFTSAKYPNVVYLEYKYSDLKKISAGFDKAEKIFIHGFYNLKIMLWLRFNAYVLRKTVLIIWGADLYNARYAIKDKEQKGLHLTHRICEILKRQLMQRVTMYMTFACADFDLAKEWYGASGKQFDCLYTSNVDIGLLDSLEKKEFSGKVNIMVGNSATRTNQHKEVLNILKKYAEENICIYCPLSYGGDSEYAVEIAEYGKKLFKDKFVAITDYMESDEYAEFLNKMDIAIFNNNRQQATANIEILSYLGKKLYIRSDTTMWKHYVERDKCSFYSVGSIKGEDFAEFFKFGNDDRDNNKKYFSKIWDEDYVKSLWDKVFEYNNKE